MKIITKQQEFNDFLERAKKSDIIAIDTEFLRDKTYWAKLCLLQLANDDEFALVDPFSVDIKPLTKILENQKIVKVFHSPRQDIEILFNITNIIPETIFDTQVAAAFLGYNIQIGYANLVLAELGVKLNKNDTFTDWSLRPLSDSQLEYAKNDVTYLVKLYRQIVKKLEQQNRLQWVKEDIKTKYCDRKIYEIDPRQRLWHLKRITGLKARELAMAKELAAWREVTAMKRNVPRRWILSDDAIISLCKSKPENLGELLNMRGIKEKIHTAEARAIMQAIEKAKKYKDNELPDINEINKNNRKESNNHDIDSQIDLMCAIVRLRAKQNNIAPQMLSSNSDLSKIAHGAKSGIPTLSGWRKKIVGDELLNLVDGKVMLSIKNGEVEIMEA